MACLECNRPIAPMDIERSITSFGVELCPFHQERMIKLMALKETPLEAVRLYYALKKEGVHPMLEWWNGERYVHLAISRVKLNIDIEMESKTITPEQALKDLEEAMFSFKNGFISMRIPYFLVNDHKEETVAHIVEIIKGLKTHIKVV